MQLSNCSLHNKNCAKNEVFHEGNQILLPNPQEYVHLVTFTEEILNEKRCFFVNADILDRDYKFKKYIHLSINVSVFRIVVFVIRNDFHCMKSLQIRSFSGPYFPLFGLNTVIYSANLLIQSEFREIKTLYLDTFYAVFSNIALLWNIVLF